MKKTKIEWCDSTFNPVTGCLRGCPYCYAKAMVNRFSGGTDDDQSKLYVEDKPVRGKDGKIIPYPHGFAPTFHRYRLEQIRHWKNEEPRNIFICSMADLFGEWVPDEWVSEIIEALDQAPQHNYLFLTKNVFKLDELLALGKIERKRNFWLGTTTTKASDMFFISNLANTFVSIEPMHGPLEVIPERLKGWLKWAIIGAETGNRKDKIIPEPEWVLEAAAGLKALGIPVFMKDSLIPIVGEENMLREFPEGLMK